MYKMTDRLVYAADAETGAAEVSEIEAPAVAETETSASAVSETTEKPEPRPASWEVTRINQITRERHEEARMRVLAERERDELRAQVAKPATPQSEIEARAEALATEKFSRYQEEQRTRTWNETCNRVADAGISEYPDFDATVATLNATGAMKTELIEAALEISDKDAHKVLYQLGKNPAEAARIAELSPARMAAALAKIAASVSAPPAPASAARAVSRAPAPIDPVSGGKAGSAETDPEKMTAEQYATWFEALNKRR